LEVIILFLVFKPPVNKVHRAQSVQLDPEAFIFTTFAFQIISLLSGLVELV